MTNRVHLACATNLEHAHAWKTVEKSTRAQHAVEHLAACNLVERCEKLDPRPVSEAELLSVHTQRHIDEVSAPWSIRCPWAMTIACSPAHGHCDGRSTASRRRQRRTRPTVSCASPTGREVPEL